ncbi:MAG: hypothetical protein ACRD1H_17630, partial [Vicinamibacterales bacterium]
MRGELDIRKIVCAPGVLAGKRRAGRQKGERNGVGECRLHRFSARKSGLLMLALAAVTAPVAVSKLRVKEATPVRDDLTARV